MPSNTFIDSDRASVRTLIDGSDADSVHTLVMDKKRKFVLEVRFKDYARYPLPNLFLGIDIKVAKVDTNSFSEYKSDLEVAAKQHLYAFANREKISKKPGMDGKDLDAIINSMKIIKLIAVWDSLDPTRPGDPFMPNRNFSSSSQEQEITQDNWLIINERILAKGERDMVRLLISLEDRIKPGWVALEQRIYSSHRAKAAGSGAVTKSSKTKTSNPVVNTSKAATLATHKTGTATKRPSEALSIKSPSKTSTLSHSAKEKHKVEFGGPSDQERPMPKRSNIQSHPQTKSKAQSGKIFKSVFG